MLQFLPQSFIGLLYHTRGLFHPHQTLHGGKNDLVGLVHISRKNTTVIPSIVSRGENKAVQKETRVRFFGDGINQGSGVSHL